jgi:Flp pilus assembly protein TadD
MSKIDNLEQGVRLGLAGNYGKATSELTLAAEQQPSSADVLVNLGVALHKSGDDDRALASYDGALKLSPKHAEAHYFRANILYARKLIPAGIAEYKLAIGLQLK